MSNGAHQIKLSTRTTELLFELRHYETVENMQILAGDLNKLNSKLLRLFRTTDNPQSQGLILELLSEMGYSWFRRFAERNASISKASCMPTFADIMSEDKFLDLVPVNGYFH